ncbi:MAG: hypothetical protein KGL43_14875 [Burkholderiales bacterium]|nr:hypothetical protein [Burkholderiales bacterium]MDE2395610.1 hypothetical protein [Burkholderiales bacterium]MDE2454873.1 hypothetical protein [Burkholderiales bacterium]
MNHPNPDPRSPAHRCRLALSRWESEGGAGWSLVERRLVSAPLKLPTATAERLR